jgi:hypothetical protein
MVKALCWGSVSWHRARRYRLAPIAIAGGSGPTAIALRGMKLPFDG